MKTKEYGVVLSLSLLTLFMHCKNLYELPLVEKIICYGSLSHMSPFLTIEDICYLQARDLQCVNAEMLKWTGKEAHARIGDMFNHALQHAIALQLDYKLDQTFKYK